MNRNDDRGFLNVNRRIKSTCHLQKKWNVFGFDLSLSFFKIMFLSHSHALPFFLVVARCCGGGKAGKCGECIITAVSNRSWSSKKIERKTTWEWEGAREMEREKEKKCANLLRPAFSEQCFCCDLHNAKILDALIILFINHSLRYGEIFFSKLI